MANQNKTTVALAVEFPYDISTFKPGRRDVEIFDRGTENPQSRFSIKGDAESYDIISEDEKYIFELMDGKRTIDEIAALFMEEKGRIALTLIRNFIYRLWQSGLLLDSDKATEAPPVEVEKQKLNLLPIPGNPLSKILYNTLGILLLNPLSVLLLLGLGVYGAYILNDLYETPGKAPALFTFKGSPVNGMLIMMATFFIASIINFKSRLAAYGKYKVSIKRSGLMMGQIIPGLFIEAPGLEAIKSKSRFFTQVAGMIVILGISGILLLLFKHLPETQLQENRELLFQVPFYLLIYLIYHCCPLLNNDLYLGCSAYLDEPYLRKSSFAFVSGHIKKFFSPAGEGKDDNVIYIMFSAGALFWLACSAQLLLTAISQNSKVINSLFAKEQSISSWVVIIIILLPIFSALAASLILLYKVSIKAITSQEFFKNTRNLVIFSSILLFCFIFLMKLTSQGTGESILLFIAAIGSYLAIWHSIKTSFRLDGCYHNLQYYFLAGMAATNTIFFTFNLFNYGGHTLKYLVLISYTLMLLSYSCVNLKTDWGEFLGRRRDSLIISSLMLLVTAGIVLISSKLQTEITASISFASGETITDSIVQIRTASLFCIIIGGLSLIMNIPKIVYQRGTQSFAPNFAITFALHLILYFYVILGLSPNSLPIYEALTAASLLLIVGIGSFKIAINGKHNLNTYPIEIKKSEKEILITAFSYITLSALDVIKDDWGISNKKTIISRFNRHAKKIGWKWTLLDPIKDENINTLGNTYDQAFLVFKKQLVAISGHAYTKSLLLEIEDHLHSSAKEIIHSRISNFSANEKQKRATNLTKEKKSAIVKDIILFENIEGDDMPKLLDCLHSSSYETGDLIITQGDDGDRLFILVDGKAQVEIEDLAGNSNAVAYISENEFFGEIALLTSSERTASIRALEPCSVLYLKRKDFDSILGLNPEKKSTILSTLNYLRLLKTIPLFRGIDSSTINMFTSKMEKETFKKGDNIITQGEEGDKFYVILEGDVNVHVVRDDNKDHSVANLSKGEYFGEIALFKNIPRTASITANSENTLVLSLNKEHFVKAIESQNNLESNLENVTHRRIVQMMN